MIRSTMSAVVVCSKLGACIQTKQNQNMITLPLPINYYHIFSAKIFLSFTLKWMVVSIPSSNPYFNAKFLISLLGWKTADPAHNSSFSSDLTTGVFHHRCGYFAVAGFRNWSAKRTILLIKQCKAPLSTIQDKEIHALSINIEWCPSSFICGLNNLIGSNAYPLCCRPTRQLNEQSHLMVLKRLTIFLWSALVRYLFFLSPRQSILCHLKAAAAAARFSNCQHRVNGPNVRLCLYLFVYLKFRYFIIYRLSIFIAKLFRLPFRHFETT